jgi:hypothetical protein
MYAAVSSSPSIPTFTNALGIGYPHTSQDLLLFPKQCRKGHAREEREADNRVPNHAAEFPITARRKVSDAAFARGVGAFPRWIGSDVKNHGCGFVFLDYKSGRAGEIETGDLGGYA